MGIGVIIGGVKAFAGVVTCNPVLIADGVLDAGKSFLIGEITAPITEPIKEIVGEAIGDADWAEIAETCPMW